MTSRNRLTSSSIRLSPVLLIVALSLTLSPVVPAWSQSPNGHAEDEADLHAVEASTHDSPIVLDAHDIERMGIEVAAAGPGTIRKTLSLPGEIALNEDRVAHIVPRFDGVVREVRKRLGDSVIVGEVMAVIESNISLQTYDVKSLIAGTIVDKHITLGEFVTTDSDVYVVADLTDVWVDIAVYARDQGAASVGQDVQVRSKDLNLNAAAVISYVSPLVDQHTRTSLARAVLPNPEGRWRPGSFVTAELRSDAVDIPVVVPNGAIETVDGHQAVFVQEIGGFSIREVTIGLANDLVTEVIEGLTPGDLIVIRGSFTLKAELMKESFGDGHAH